MIILDNNHTLDTNQCSGAVCWQIKIHNKQHFMVVLRCRNTYYTNSKLVITH